MLTISLGIVIFIGSSETLLLSPPLRELLHIGVYSRRVNRQVLRPLCVEKNLLVSIIYYMKAPVIGRTHLIRLLQVLIEKHLPWSCLAYWHPCIKSAFTTNFTNGIFSLSYPPSIQCCGGF
jgi:hypothetical protein